MISPHGGRLVNQVLSPAERKQVLAKKDQYQRIKLDESLIKDVYNIGVGAFSPLTGFLGQKNFESVCKHMRLSDGTVWPIPIVLDVDGSTKKKIENEAEILLVSTTGEAIGVLKKPEIYPYDRQKFAQQVFGTLDQSHPGVDEVLQMQDYLVGGQVFLINGHKLFPDHNLTPRQTRQMFVSRGWETVAAFQTRNVPHRGHEFLQMQALARVDGLFIQPVIGKKKLEDFKDEYIVAAYDILIDKYYPSHRVVLGILPLKMRYAGPREAVLHAIVRKNYGCTHLIVGRDHAGAGDFYPPFAAQQIFDNFTAQELGVEILKFDEVVYYPHKKMHDYATLDTADEQIKFSGTRVRNLIKDKEQPPAYLMRPEVYHLLVNSSNTMVDKMYKKRDGEGRGFVLWFTGLSQSGKSTIADRVFKILQDKGITVERLDGDVVRESLTADLGFSKKDRDENITRVGFVSSLLSKNGVGVVASFISPYKERREHVRQKTENFIEVYVSTPVEVCAERDKKGLYEKARAGEIKNFTGISDPYEAPENPDILLKPHKDPLEKSVQKVVEYLRANAFLK